jgi:hypothetical protein
MKWYAKPVEVLRRQGSISMEKPRQLAFELAMGAADLAGVEPPAGLEELSTAEVLRIASHALALAQGRVQSLNHRIDVLEKATVARDSDAEPLRPALADVVKDPPEIAADLIEIFDHLASRPDDPARRWLENRLSRIAMKCEISWIDDSGPVDLTKHEIIGVRPATDGNRPGDIAVTIRPGYLQRGRIIRAQQVIAFAEDHGS